MGQIDRDCAYSAQLLKRSFPWSLAEAKSSKATGSRSGKPHRASSANCRSAFVTSLSNGLLCVSLWLSLLLAIWLTRGWLGLLFSGQALSAGAYLVKGMARRTQLAFSLDSGTIPQIRGENHVS
jgi:hypothetical protein